MEYLCAQLNLAVANEPWWSPCTGHEDVPQGCVAVLAVSGGCPDILSHSAVRLYQIFNVLFLYFSGTLIPYDL